MKTKKAAIGVFDSGFGGLSILKDIIKALPQYQYVYLGDTARTPYGNRSQAVIYEFTKEAVTLLFDQGCELIVVACNTASSEALRRIQQEYLPRYYPDKKVLGVLIPASEEAAHKTKNKRIGVLATTGTVRSKAFIREIQKVDPKIRVFQAAAPLLVPAIEAGEHTYPSTKLLITRYLKPLLARNIDTLILGCTHYGLIEGEVKKNLKTDVTLISEGKVVAKALKDYLKRHPEISVKLSHRKGVHFLTTDLTDTFGTLGKQFFGSKISPEKVVLSKIR